MIIYETYDLWSIYDPKKSVHCNWLKWKKQVQNPQTKASLEVDWGGLEQPVTDSS